MKKTAFIFPGQGAQYIGMAMDFIENDNTLKSILELFDKKHNTSLFKIMSEGPEELLKETKYTQPAILFHSYAALNYFKKNFDIEPVFVAGHSLGEFSSLVANNVLSIDDALHLVHKRGEFMIKANEGKPFGMTAIIGLSPEKVKEICEEASKTDIVIPANFNTPVQTVISGSKLGIEKAEELSKLAGAKRIVPLVVGGPFHSPLIAKAAEWLREEMDKIDFNNASIPVVSNVDAKPHTKKEEIKENLTKQVTSSVLWVQSVEYMINQGVERFIEFGPKKVLSGMIKKIDRKIQVFNLDKIEDLENIKQKISE